jgi:ArsR family transcriptional regulator, arsenate/arsenite/antimonite-responsive transcriptional repressor
LTYYAIRCIIAYVKNAIEAFKAVGEATRFRALRLFLEAKADLCTCEIIDVLQKPQYTISKSLGALVDSELLDERREGRMMMYSLVHTPVNDGIFQAVAKVRPTEELVADSKRLASRLAKRKDGLCIDGC